MQLDDLDNADDESLGDGIMMWEPPDDIEVGAATNEVDGGSGDELRKKRSKMASDIASTTMLHTHSRLLDGRIKIALSLYKVQQNIYLLDFQRVEVRKPVVRFRQRFLCFFYAGGCVCFYEVVCFHNHGVKEFVCCFTSGSSSTTNCSFLALNPSVHFVIHLMHLFLLQSENSSSRHS